MGIELISSKANCQLSEANHEYRFDKFFIHKLAYVQSGIINDRSTIDAKFVQIPPIGGLTLLAIF